MQKKNKTMRVIYFSPKNEKITSIGLSWPKVILIPLSVFSIVSILIGFTVKTIFSFNENENIARLTKENQTLENLLGEFNEKSAMLENRLLQLKSRDGFLRTVTEMPKIDDDTWRIGTGGTKEELDLQRLKLPSTTRNYTDNMEERLNKLDQQAVLLFESLSLIEKRLLADQQMRNHTPTILPIRGGITTSRFGFRKDPFIQTRKHHNGIDIVADEGTEIISPSAGRVEIIRTKYKPQETLGKVIVINHGNGVRTRFGHLHKIYVKRNQKVKRYEKIGEVGNSGRSTGPHLHYEVIVNGRFKDPATFVLN